MSHRPSFTRSELSSPTCPTLASATTSQPFASRAFNLNQPTSHVFNSSSPFPLPTSSPLLTSTDSASSALGDPSDGALASFDPTLRRHITPLSLNPQVPLPYRNGLINTDERPLENGDSVAAADGPVSKKKRARKVKRAIPFCEAIQ